MWRCMTVAGPCWAYEGPRLLVRFFATYAVRSDCAETKNPEWRGCKEGGLNSWMVQLLIMNHEDI